MAAVLSTLVYNTDYILSTVLSIKPKESRAYAGLLEVQLVELDAVELDGEVARVAHDNVVLLIRAVREHRTELEAVAREVEARLDARPAAHECTASTALQQAECNPLFVALLHVKADIRVRILLIINYY